MALQLVDSPSPLRIAVLAHLHHPIRIPFAGGMESHTAHLVNDLALRGHDVTLFAKEGSDPFEAGTGGTVESTLAQNYVIGGYPDEDQENEQHRTLDRAMESAIKKIRAGNFDVVINNSLSPVPHERLQGIPTLHILHTPPLPRIIEVHRSQKNIDTMHRFATVSRSNARSWKRWIPQLLVVSNGIDLDKWAPTPATIIHPGKASWTGRLTPEKGPHLAIDAARSAGLHLYLAGPIQDRSYFENLIVPYLDHQIHYLGHLDQNELKNLIATSEVFISTPLWEEPFGLTTLEAMACGTPVAALPSGAMSELIGSTGGAVAQGLDAEALSKSIGTARSMDRGAVLGRASQFSRDRMLDAYEALISEILPLVPTERRAW